MKSIDELVKEYNNFFDGVKKAIEENNNNNNNDVMSSEEPFGGLLDSILGVDSNESDIMRMAKSKNKEMKKIVG